MKPAAPVTRTFMLEPAIDVFGRKHVLDVEQHVIALAQLPHRHGSHGLELPVSDGNDRRVVSTLAQFAYRLDAVFVARFRGINPRIMDLDDRAVLLELTYYVDHLRIADIGTILLERQA